MLYFLHIYSTVSFTYASKLGLIEADIEDDSEAEGLTEDDNDGDSEPLGLTEADNDGDLLLLGLVETDTELLIDELIEPDGLNEPDSLMLIELLGHKLGDFDGLSEADGLKLGEPLPEGDMLGLSLLLGEAE